MIEIIDLGRIRYGDAMDLMEARVAERARDHVPDTLYLLEHEPVLTLGRGADRDHVLASADHLSELGVEVVQTGRGGDVTYHGPGQVVGYSVVSLAPDRKDVRRYVHDLEGVMIDACAAFGIEAGRVDGLIGAWVADERKIGAIGVRISRWVTSHGFALNVERTALGPFQLIVPCGIQDRYVTCLEAETDREVSLDAVKDVLGEAFQARFARASAASATSI